MAYRPSELIPHTGMCILWLLQPLSILPPLGHYPRLLATASFVAWHLCLLVTLGCHLLCLSPLLHLLLVAAFSTALGGRYFYYTGPSRSLILAAAFFTLSHCSIRSSLLPPLEAAAFAAQVATSFAIANCRFLYPQLPLVSILLVTVFYASHGNRFLCSCLPLSPLILAAPSLAAPLPWVAARIATCFALATAHFAARRFLVAL